MAVKCSRCEKREVAYSDVCAICAPNLSEDERGVRLEAFRKTHWKSVTLWSYLVITFAFFIPSFVLIFWLPNLSSNPLLDALAWDLILCVPLTWVMFDGLVLDALKGEDKKALDAHQEKKRIENQAKTNKKLNTVLAGLKYPGLFGKYTVGIKGNHLHIVQMSDASVKVIAPEQILGVEVLIEDEFDGYEIKPQVKPQPGIDGAIGVAVARAMQDTQLPIKKFKQVYKVKLEVKDMKKPVWYFVAEYNRESAESLAIRIKLLMQESAQERG